MAEILLVRHGQASFGTDDYDCLSELGEKQAHWAGEFLQRSGVKLDAIYSGALKRQQQTAQRVVTSYANNGLILPEPIIDARFNELDNEAQMHQLGPVLAKTNPQLNDLIKGSAYDTKQFQKLLKVVFFHWVLDNPQVDGLESWPDFKARTTTALSEICKVQGRGKTIAAFTSGGVIATLVAHVMGMPDSKVYSVFEPLINASITRLLYNDDEISMLSYNEHSHLPLVSNEANSVSFR